MAAAAVGEFPGQTSCPHCHQSVTTDVRPIKGGLTWLLCVVMCIFGCWPCACIPFCVDSCQDVEHYCPNCKNLIGRYRRL